MPLLNVYVPEIPYPGGSTQADFYRSAASNIEQGYAIGGSNVTAAVIALLRATAQALQDNQTRSSAAVRASEFDDALKKEEER